MLDSQRGVSARVNDFKSFNFICRISSNPVKDRVEKL